jgi:hypothetical protein
MKKRTFNDTVHAAQQRRLNLGETKLIDNNLSLIRELRRNVSVRNIWFVSYREPYRIGDVDYGCEKRHDPGFRVRESFNEPRQIPKHIKSHMDR